MIFLMATRLFIPYGLLFRTITTGECWDKLKPQDKVCIPSFSVSDCILMILKVTLTWMILIKDFIMSFSVLVVD